MLLITDMNTEQPHKIVVAAFVFICRSDEILLVKQSYGKGYWSLPGGVVEVGEAVDEAAMREVKEETGLDIRVGKLIGVYSKPDEGALALTFQAEVIGGVLDPQGEISAVCFFPLAQLPSNVRAHLRQRADDFLSGFPYAVVRTQ